MSDWMVSSSAGRRSARSAHATVSLAPVVGVLWLVFLGCLVVLLVCEGGEEGVCEREKKEGEMRKERERRGPARRRAAREKSAVRRSLFALLLLAAQ
jgi:hypothetical protein